MSLVIHKKDLAKAEAREELAARFLECVDELSDSEGEAFQVEIRPVASQSYYKTAEVAAAFQVSDRMVRRWCEQGKIEATQTPGGTWRIPAAQFGDLSKVRAFQATAEKVNQRFAARPAIKEFER